MRLILINDNLQVKHSSNITKEIIFVSQNVINTSILDLERVQNISSQFLFQILLILCKIFVSSH